FAGPSSVVEDAVVDHRIDAFGQFGFGHPVCLVYDKGAWVDGEKTKAGRGCALHIGFGLEMIGIGAPWAAEAFLVQRIGRRGHDLFRGALGAIHFADGLLREDRSEIEFARGGEVARGGEAEAIAETEGLLQTECNWMGLHFENW